MDPTTVVTPVAEAAHAAATTVPPVDLGTIVQVDASDPIVAALAWAITFGINSFAKKKGFTRLQYAAPTIALLASVALRAAYAPLMGEPLTKETLLRAVAAGGVAVLSHSQVREMLKFRDPVSGDPISKEEAKSAEKEPVEKEKSPESAGQPPTDAA